MPGRLRFSLLTLSLPTGEPLIVALGSPPRVSKLGTNYAHHELRVSSYRLQTVKQLSMVMKWCLATHLSIIKRARECYGRRASMQTLPDYYAILHVHPEAELKVILAAHRRMYLKHYPDVYHGAAAKARRAGW